MHGDALVWQPSPMPGVERRMLDRVGDEVARATTIVRYARGSAFSPHVHGGGEEFLVLAGTFVDEHGSYPVGSYVRNPPTSAHTPSAPDGCTILVKLRQFAPNDRTTVRDHASDRVFTKDPALPGVTRALLFEDAREQVTLEQWTSRSAYALDAPSGAEVFVCEGSFALETDGFRPHSWLRLPAGDRVTLDVGPDGATVWVKRYRAPARLG